MLGVLPSCGALNPGYLTPHPVVGFPLVEESCACGSYDVRNVTKVAEGGQGCRDDGCGRAGDDGGRAGDDGRHARGDSRYAGNDYTHAYTFCEGGCFLVISYKFPRNTETTAHLTQKELSSGNCLTTRYRFFFLMFVCLFFQTQVLLKAAKWGEK